VLLILITAAILSFMIFFPAVVATSVFKVLDEKASSKFLRIFFPKYYLFGFILSCLGLLVSVYKHDKISLFFFIFISLSFVFSKQILMPMINKAKDESKEIKFNKLHKSSVFINFLQIISCVVLLVMYLK
jgi:hypothetical protein